MCAKCLIFAIVLMCFESNKTRRDSDGHSSCAIYLQKVVCCVGYAMVPSVVCG